MNAILKKYRIEDTDFLVYDTILNQDVIDSRMARLFCCQNFGLHTKAILVGPIDTQEGDIMKAYAPDGNELPLTGEVKELASYLLAHQGETPHKQDAGISYVGKVFVYLENANSTKAA